MFTLWMFGKTLENVWGGKRFLTFYMITGLGGLLYIVFYVQFQINELSQFNSDYLNLIKGRKILYRKY